LRRTLLHVRRSPVCAAVRVANVVPARGSFRVSLAFTDVAELDRARLEAYLIDELIAMLSTSANLDESLPCSTVEEAAPSAATGDPLPWEAPLAGGGRPVEGLSRSSLRRCLRDRGRAGCAVVASATARSLVQSMPNAHCPQSMTTSGSLPPRSTAVPGCTARPQKSHS